jgi:hypothetical protein
MSIRQPSVTTSVQMIRDVFKAQGLDFKTVDFLLALKDEDSWRFSRHQVQRYSVLR